MMVRDRIHRDRISFSYVLFFILIFSITVYMYHTNHPRKRKKTLSNKFNYALVYEKLTLTA